MPEQVVSIADSSGHRASIDSRGHVLVGNFPETYQFYFHTLIDVPGVALANNFLSLLNPVGSNKLLIFFQAEITAYAIAATGGSDSMVARRITTASAGTQISAASVNRFLTTAPNPTTEVRVNNPTVTLDPTFTFGLNSWQPPQTTGVGGSAAASTTAPGEGFVCLPGQGIVFNTATGDTDQRWKINTIWAEAPI